MGKIALKWGFVSGLILVILFVIIHAVTGFENGYSQGETIGYLAMILALSLTYFGMRDYRNTKLAGNINFMQAVFFGILTVFIASVIYGVYSFVLFEYLEPNLLSDIQKMYIEELESSDISAEEKAMVINQIEEMAVMYMNPIFQGAIMGLTTFGIGLIVSLLSSLFVRKSIN